VRNLAVFLGRSPDTATAEDLRLFQLHLTKTQIHPRQSTAVSALRLFFTDLLFISYFYNSRTVTARVALVQP
jgi:Phage integrase, N-terminal SAM-like domain